MAGVMDRALEWKLGRKIKLSIGHRNTSCRRTSQYYRAWGIFCMLQSICKSMSNNIGPKTSEEMWHPNQDEDEGVIWQWLEVIIVKKSHLRICSCQARKWQWRILRETDISQHMTDVKMNKRGIRGCEWGNGEHCIHNGTCMRLESRDLPRRPCSSISTVHTKD